MITDDIFISPINPIGFTDIRPESYYDFKHNPIDCYAQKFENSDTTIIQVLSKKSVQEVNLIRAFDNKKIKSYTITAKGIANVSSQNSFIIISPDNYGVYESKINFEDLEDDLYYLEIISNTIPVKFSDLIHVSEKWENTLLIEYANTSDHEGFKFNIEEEEFLSIRVEGTIREFQPSSDDNIYTDQPHRTHILSSVPYRKFTLFLGGKNGIPDYLADIINRAFTVDHIFIDEDRFNKTEESEWEVQRDPDVEFMAMSTEIQSIDPVLNFSFPGLLQEDLQDPSDWVIFRRSANRTSSTDFVISSIIKDKTTLEYITVYKKEANPYILKVGTSPGANDILETQITESIETLHLRQNFDKKTTLHFSGITESQDFHIVYEKLDKRGGELGGNNNSNNGDLPINSIIIYGGTPQQLSADFNLETGLARSSSEYSGFAICDGRNGTYNFIDSFAYGWDLKEDQIGDVVGENRINLKESELPKITPKWIWEQGMKNDTFQGRDGTIYVDMATANKPSNNNPINRNPIEEIGGGEKLDIRSKRTLSIYIQKIN